MHNLIKEKSSMLNRFAGTLLNTDAAREMPRDRFTPAIFPTMQFLRRRRHPKASLIRTPPSPTFDQPPPPIAEPIKRFQAV
jgi:hypothetical protein